MTRVLDRAGWAVAGALAVGLILTVARLAGAGPLDPSNPPGPSMKTLVEVEPRTAISGLPYTITSPGSYYLTGDLTGTASAHGIVVSASNVTIDMNGYAMTGTPSSFTGITTFGGFSNITIRNGAVQFFPGGGVRLAIRGVTLEDLAVRESTSEGPGIELGENARVTDCLVHSDMVGHAVSVGSNSLVDGCLVDGGVNGIVTGGDSTVRDCDVTRSVLNGVLAGAGSRVMNCQISFTEIFGIRGFGDNLIIDNELNGNGTDPSGVGCHVQMDGQGSRIESNHMISGDAGVCFASVGATANTVYGNSLRGIAPGSLYLNAGGNDIGPTGMAATATSPFTNVVVP